MSTDSPTQTKLGYEHYVCFPNDGLRHEIIDGQHYMNPSPTTYHQKVSIRLSHLLYMAIEERELGEVFAAPIDVQLSEYDIFQPDLVVLLTAPVSIVTPSKIKGTPHLIVEILSPSTADYDRILKKQRYLQAGVPEYWIVDLDEQVLQQFVLQDGQYAEHRQSGTVTLTITEGIVIDLSKVW